MDIQEIYNSIDNQYNLYISGEGADEEICNDLFHLMSNIAENHEIRLENNFMNYWQKIVSIIFHFENGVMKTRGIKLRYTVDDGHVSAQMI